MFASPSSTPTRSGASSVWLPLTLGAVLLCWSGWWIVTGSGREIPSQRERVIFWHFWGGDERIAVKNIVRRFNESQNEYWVDEIPIPGQNLDMKFFMALSGGVTPDVVNQDDQVIAQWAERGVLTPLRELCDDETEYERLRNWLNTPARQIGTYEGELYALCNALDIRTILYRPTELRAMTAPKTIAEFDALVKRPATDPARLPFLPDDRRLWAWGIAFGGDFYDEATATVTANDPRIVAALEWMVSYTRFHGESVVQTFRSTNREVGASSMLLEGRYLAMLDGQWRVPQLDEAAKTTPEFDYEPLPLPFPPGGREGAGWVNGNFFLVPRSARNPKGAWAFMKFWSGFDGHEEDAAMSAASGGWIPPSAQVVKQPAFQRYLATHPKFRTFVDLSTSPHQVPTPAMPVQAYFFERVNLATQQAINGSKSPKDALDDATRDVQSRLDAFRAAHGGNRR